MFLLVAFGKSIYCLAKIGEELYIEAMEDGVSINSPNTLVCTAYRNVACIVQ